MQIVVVVSQFCALAACQAVAQSDVSGHAPACCCCACAPLSSDAEEDNDARDVIDGSVLFLPTLDRFLNNGLSRPFC